MTIIVTDNCKQCRFTECVAVCPVSCFHCDEQMVYIDNAVCIDCRACIPVCPVKAIYDADDMPDSLKPWIAINAERSAALPVIDQKQDPLLTAERRRAELGF